MPSSTPCAAAGCDRLVHARGHCERHYRQLLRRGELVRDPAPRACAVGGCALLQRYRPDLLAGLRSGERPSPL